MPSASEPSLHRSEAVLTTVVHAITVGDWRVTGKASVGSLIRRLKTAILLENVTLAGTLSAELANDGLQAISDRNWVIPAGHATITLTRLGSAINI